MKENKYTAAVLTLGCRVNQYESRALMESFAASGLNVIGADDIESLPADIYVINTCAVTAESERKSRQLIRRCQRRNPNAIIAVTGCASQLSSSNIGAIDGVSIIAGSRGKDAIGFEALRLLNGGIRPTTPIIINDTFDFSRQAFSDIAKLKLGVDIERARAYIKIEDGCDGKCAYCIIPTVRGEVIIRPMNEVCEEIKRVADSGIKEVVLTGIETSAYGEPLGELIERAADIDGIERIRLGSMDPAFLRPNFIDRVSEIDKFMPHFHLSLQSGCSRTLAAMRRRYNAETAEERVEYIRKRFNRESSSHASLSRLMLSADIICGFPGESDDDFNETLQRIERLRLLHAHIFVYSRRPGTLADSMDEQIDESVKGKRSSQLSILQNVIKYGLLDEVVADSRSMPILVETVSNGIAGGHTDNFIEAEFRCDGDIRGQIVNVKPVSHDGDKIFCVAEDKGFDFAIL